MKTITVKMLCHYGTYAPGDTATLPSGIAQTMIEAKRASLVTKVVKAERIRNKSVTA